MNYQLCVDSSEFVQSLEENLKTCQQSFYVQTLSFEGDKAGRYLEKCFASLPQGVDRRLIIDDYSNYIVNDKFLYDLKGLRNSEIHQEKKEMKDIVKRLEAIGVGVKYVNPIKGWLNRLSARNHKKIISIDQKCAYLGGINFSAHNFEWHDLMIGHYSPEVVECLNDDFRKTWNGINQIGEFKSKEINILFLNGPNSFETCKDLFTLLEGAQKEIFVESPYFSFPFYESLAKAKKNGAIIRLIVPNKNNWGLYDSYTKEEILKNKIEVKFYPERMNHTKCMLVDQKYLIIGSSNFDYFSLYHHQEIIAIIQDQTLIEEFIQRVDKKDWNLSLQKELHFGFLDKLKSSVLKTAITLVSGINS
jgi:cardiolipin synthase